MYRGQVLANLKSLVGSPMFVNVFKTFTTNWMRNRFTLLYLQIKSVSQDPICYNWVNSFWRSIRLIMVYAYTVYRWWGYFYYDYISLWTKFSHSTSRCRTRNHLTTRTLFSVRTTLFINDYPNCLCIICTCTQ